MEPTSAVTWRRRAFAAQGITQVPPGPHIDRLARRPVAEIRVSSPRYDDIGAVLTSMGVAFQPFTGDYGCDLLFVNCGTSDRFDVESLRRFVTEGGCLYASDLTDDLVDAAFPRQFRFGGSGAPGTIQARVVDGELRDVIGEHTEIHFDLSGWTILEWCAGDVLVEAAPGSEHAGRPLMAAVGVGRGAVFYTSFHNRSQTSDQELVLLKLLVLKQIGASSDSSLAEAGRSVGVNVSALRPRG